MESHQLHLISTYRDMCFSRSWRSEVPIHSVETINAIQPSNPFIAAHGATGIRVEGDSGNDTLFGKSMEKPNSKSKSNVWLVFQISCDDITSLNFGKRDSNMFKLFSSCFMLQVSSYPLMPSPAPVLTLQVAPEKQLKHVGSTPTKSTVSRYISSVKCHQHLSAFHS